MATLTSSYQYLGRSSVMTSTNGNLSYYVLLYGKTSANQTTGIHTVTIKEVLASTTNNATYYYYTQAHNGTINGSKAFEGTNKPSKAWELSNFTAGGVTYKTGTLLGEGSVNVDCTNGLAKNITLTCYYLFNGNAASYTPAKGTSRRVSVTATLSAIPRKATLLTAPNFYDTDNPIVTYSNPTGENVTALEIGIFNDTGSQSYIPYRSDISKTGTSYTFNFTDAEREVLRAACTENSLAVRFYIRTTLGSTIYLSYLARTLTINDANPIIRASVVDINDTTFALTGARNKLIKYFSNAHASMTAEAQKGASINEDLYIIRNGSNSAYEDTHIFENVESNSFVFSAEDSRGNIGTTTVEIPMVDYVKLTCNMASNRPDALGNMTVACSGNYFNDTFGRVENELSVQYRYAISGSAFTATWYDMEVTKYSDSYYATADFVIDDYNQNLAYIFETRAIDKLSTISSNSGAVKSTPIFHWGENDYAFEVPVYLNNGVEGDLKVSGDLWLKGSGNYGNTIYFGDKSYVSISEATDDALTFKSAAINFDVLGLSVYGSVLSDFVVEQGTSNSWSYRKWNSGVAECWITNTISTSITTAWNSMYVGDTSSTQMSYPVSFVSRPREMANLHAGSYAVWLYTRANNTSTQTGVYNLVRPTSVSGAITVYYDLYVIGKWK